MKGAVMITQGINYQRLLSAGLRTKWGRALCVIAVAVYGYGARSDLRDVFGADVLAGCKGPCDDTGTLTRNECLDPCDYFGPCAPGDQTVNGCNKNYCTINTYHLFTCAAGAPGAGDTTCNYHFDDADWYRSSSVRISACGDGGINTQNLPPCQYAGSVNSFETPCTTGACAGVVKADNINKLGRRLCGDGGGGGGGHPGPGPFPE
jgi:hypothetical protein